MAKVLVVDDDENIRKLVRITAEGRGHEVWESADGSDAIDKMERFLPDLVVLDMMMPGLDGHGVLREMTRSGLKSKTKVLMLTARTAEADMLTSWRLGIDDYITKPFDIDDLARRIDEVMRTETSALRERRDEEIEKSGFLSKIENFFDQDR